MCCKTIQANIFFLYAANFEPVDSTSLTAEFGPQGGVFGSIQVVSQSTSSTTVSILVPAFNIGSSSRSISVPVVLTPASRPDRAVSFTYEYYVAVPTVQTIEPTSASSQGGIQVFLTLRQFPPGQSFAVVFAGIPVADTDVVVWDASGLSTLLMFITPATLPGLAEVRVFTKGCATPCTSSVTFTFEQLDNSLPVLLPPFVTSGPYQQAELVVRFSKFPASGEVQVLFGSTNGWGARMQEASDADVTSVRLVPPLSQGAGPCKITVSCSGKRISFEYTFYDGLALRLANKASIQIVPTATALWGRQVELVSDRALIVANCPQGLQQSQVTVVVRTSQSLISQALPAQVLSIDDVAMCTNRVDCNRTLLLVRMPTISSPGIKAASISFAERGLPSLEFDVEYAPACAQGYAAYCELQGTSMVPDTKRLMDQPSAGCRSELCVDSRLMLEPQLQSVSPTQGPASGGTLITVTVSNFPCFSPNNLLVAVGQGADTAFATVLSLIPAPGSDLLRGKSVIILRTPPASAAFWEMMTFTLKSLEGGPALSKTASFSFEFLPLVVGPPRVLSFVPSSVLESSDLALAVSLANVPRFSFPFNTSTISIQINGAPVLQEPRIMESSRSETVFSLFVPGPWTESSVINLTVCVMPKCNEAAVLRIDVLQPPDPQVSAIFPSSIPSLGSHTLAASLVYMPLSIKLSQISAVLNTQGQNEVFVNVTSLRRLSPSSCVVRDCTIFAVTLASPLMNPDGMDAGGPANLSFVFSEGAFFKVTTSILYTSAAAPSMELLNPSYQFLSQLNAEPVQIILKNYPSRQCALSSSCAEEARGGGLRVM